MLHPFVSTENQERRARTSRRTRIKCGRFKRHRCQPPTHRRSKLETVPTASGSDDDPLMSLENEALIGRIRVHTALGTHRRIVNKGKMMRCPTGRLVVRRSDRFGLVHQDRSASRFPTLPPSKDHSESRDRSSPVPRPASIRRASARDRRCGASKYATVSRIGVTFSVSPIPLTSRLTQAPAVTTTAPALKVPAVVSRSIESESTASRSTRCSRRAGRRLPLQHAGRLLALDRRARHRRLVERARRHLARRQTEASSIVAASTNSYATPHASNASRRPAIPPTSKEPKRLRISSPHASSSCRHSTREL